MNRHAKLKATTVIELIIAIVILTILVALTVPTYQAVIQNNRAATYGNDFLAAIQFARNSAIKHRNLVSICAANSTRTACNSQNSWENGWIIFIDDNGDGARAAGETLLRVHDALKGDADISPSATYAITFGSEGFLNRGNGNYTIQPTGCSGELGSRVITLSNTGRASMASATCS